MVYKMNVADFQKFVSKLWKDDGEKLKMSYQKDLLDFKTFFGMSLDV